MIRFLWGVFVFLMALMGGYVGEITAKAFLQLDRVARIKNLPAEAPRSLLWPSNYDSLITLAFVTAGILGGLLLASVAFRNLVRLATNLKKMPANDILAGTLGTIAGLSIAYLISPVILAIKNPIAAPLLIIAGIILVYLGVNLMVGIKGELGLLLKHGTPETQAPPQRPKILDTNVIIDGRIAEVCRAGFLEGEIYVPGFVLDELQHIADSGDSLKRARGRRGLDILNAMQKEHKLLIRSHDIGFGDADEVDAKLVKLAKHLDGIVVTNDFNLSKVAELQGVQVLNVNELANALKPVVLPGEEMNIAIIREGKEMNQGIGYLDDGTMIVVEGARRHIGETVPAIVSSVLQTVAGKMIFANVKSANEEEEEFFDRDLRSYPGGRPRKKI